MLEETLLCASSLVNNTLQCLKIVEYYMLRDSLTQRGWSHGDVQLFIFLHFERSSGSSKTNNETHASFTIA